MNQRSVFLWGEIDDGMVLDLIQQLMSFKGNKPVTMYINSTGGSISGTFSLIQAMRTLPFPVNAVVLGNCYSAATIILATMTGERVAGPLARIMFHPISAEIGYTNHMDTASIATEMSTQWRLIADLFDQATDGKINRKNIEKFNKDVYMSPAKALKLGLIDRVASEM